MFTTLNIQKRQRGLKGLEKAGEIEMEEMARMLWRLTFRRITCLSHPSPLQYFPATNINHPRFGSKKSFTTDCVCLLVPIGPKTSQECKTALTSQFDSLERKKLKKLKTN